MKQLGQNRLLTIDQRIVLEELRGVVRVQSYNHAMDIANPLSQADVALSYIARHRFVHEHLKGDLNPLTQRRIECFIERFGEPSKTDEWFFGRRYGLIGLTPSWLAFHDALHDIYVDVWARILYRALSVSALPGAQPLRDKIERAVKKAQDRETMRDWVEAHTGVTAR